MAKYQFTAPDGGTYQIEAPDERSAEGRHGLRWTEVHADPRSPVPDTGPQLSDLDKTADAPALPKEAAGGLLPHASPAQYLPASRSWLDEASASIDAGLNKISGGRIGQPTAERNQGLPERSSAVHCKIQSVLGDVTKG